jgi:hypothetical protein
MPFMYFFFKGPRQSILLDRGLAIGSATTGHLFWTLFACYAQYDGTKQYFSIVGTVWAMRTYNNELDKSMRMFF